MIRNKKTIHPVVYLFCLCFVAGFISCVEAGQWVSLETAAKGNQNKSPLLDRTVTVNKDQSQTTRVTFEVFSFLKTSETIQDETYDTIFIEGCGPYPEIGKPDVPVKAIFVDLPDNALWSVAFLDNESITLEHINLLPVQPLPMDSMADNEPMFEKDEAIYNADKWFPGNRVLTMKVVQVRDEKKLEIRMSPVQFNPVKKSVTIIKKIQFEITLKPVAPQKQ